MRIVKLYGKEVDSNFRVYLRRVENSKPCALAICFDDSQYDYVREHKQATYSIGVENNYQQLNKYESDNLVVLSLRSWHLSRINNLDTIMNAIKEYIISKQDSRVDMKDIIRVWAVWGIEPNLIADSIIANNDRIETKDGYETMFHIEAPDNYHSNNTCIEGERISHRASRYSQMCEDCSHVEIDEDSDTMMYIENGDYSVCEGCYDNYSSCHNCDYVSHTDNLYWNERTEQYYCDECGSPEDEGSINSYDYTPTISFYDFQSNKIMKVDDYTKQKVPFYGAELEVECYGGSKYDMADEISQYGGCHEKFCYCKNDGSLSDGFEVCFMPMTFQAIKNFDFHEAVLRFRGRSKLQSYNTDTCGIHIHINREAFSDHHLFKFITFIHEFKSFVYLVSQRKAVSELNSYSRFNNGYKDRVKQKMVKDIKYKKERILNLKRTEEHLTEETKTKVSKHSTSIYGEKYVPVNLQHSNTVEVRIFKGNLKETSFRKNFEFIDSLYYYTKNNPVYKLRLKEFIQYCTSDKKRYPNLNEFLASNSDRLEKVLTFPLEVPEGLQF